MAIGNRIYVNTTTVGTGTLTLGTVKSAPFCTFAEAGIADGDQIRSYIIEEGNDFEIGFGTYNSAGPTLTRATVRLSRIAGVAGTTKMTLAGNATVRAIAAKEDLVTQDSSGNVVLTGSLTLGGIANSTHREILTAARIYYVRTDGNDANTGLVNSAGGAFLTVQKAIDALCAIDMSIYQGTIQIVDGTYTAANTLRRWLGALPPIIRGNNATPANVIINPTSADCFTNDGAPKWRILDMKLQTTTAGNGLVVLNGGVISFGNIDFGACPSGYHMLTSSLGAITGESNYTISGGGSYHMAGGGGFIKVSGLTVNIPSAVNFTGGFATASRSGGNIDAFTMTFSGAGVAGCTGTRYVVSLNGAIITLGGANYFPGNAAGTTATGGQYG